MNTVLVAPAVWRSDKAVSVTGHTRHRHRPSPIAVGFKPPDAGATLTFGPIALAASIARTATLRNAPPEMLVRWAASALTEVEWLVADGPMFALSPFVHCLADAERTSFAGRIGAGVTDLLMNALGYTWRDNASCLSRSLAPHADFIYADGVVSAHGVVLAEARGSFAATVTGDSVSRHAKDKYLRQVKPHLAGGCAHGKVVHGYSIAFGSRPGATGAFLHVAETRIAKPRGGRRPPTEPVLVPAGTPTSLALSTHRSNFSLMDAPSIVRWIDWVRDGGEYPEHQSPLSFIQIAYAGRIFLACIESRWPFGDFPYWLEDLSHSRWVLHHPRRAQRLQQGEPQFAGWFVMEENAAERFLNVLSAIIRNGRDDVPVALELPRLDPAGFATGGDEEGPPASDYTYALYRDGLALLGSPPPRRIVGHKTWFPKDGLRAG